MPAQGLYKASKLDAHKDSGMKLKCSAVWYAIYLFFVNSGSLRTQALRTTRTFHHAVSTQAQASRQLFATMASASYCCKLRKPLYMDNIVSVLGKRTQCKDC